AVRLLAGLRLGGRDQEVALGLSVRTPRRDAAIDPQGSEGVEFRALASGNPVTAVPHPGAEHLDPVPLLGPGERGKGVLLQLRVQSPSLLVVALEIARAGRLVASKQA